MAKETQETVVEEYTQDDKDAMLDKAIQSPGKTPQKASALVREWEKMLKSLRFTEIEELAIGSYFVPYEGQLGIEGLVNKSAEHMNYYVQAGWQPWNMATPYPGKYAFIIDGVQTGTLEGQWITIIWARPREIEV